MTEPRDEPVPRPAPKPQDDRRTHLVGSLRVEYNDFHVLLTRGGDTIIADFYLDPDEAEALVGWLSAHVKSVREMWARIEAKP